MGVYDFNISEYNIDSIIAILRKELQNIVINSQTSINEIKRRIAENEILLNRLKNEVDNLPDYTYQYNELRDEINRLNLALNEFIDHPIILDNIDVSGHSGIITEVQKINSQYIYANHAINDASGRNIVDTYATKDEIGQNTSAIYDTINSVSGTLTDKINQEKEEREIIEDKLWNSILESVSAIYDTISAESAERKNEENNLYNIIDEESRRAIEEEKQLFDAISATSGNLNQKIDNVSENLISVSSTLNTTIKNTAEQLSGDIDNLSDSLTDEITNRISTDNTLQNNITVLQGQIETIEATQNVIDLVGTYTDLQNYDTTNVKIHDKIQVITDSTHDNQSTIYSWENNSWSYIGMFGPYYTKSQVDTIHQTNNLVVTYNNEIVTLSVG